MIAFRIFVCIIFAFAIISCQPIEQNDTETDLPIDDTNVETIEKHLQSDDNKTYLVIGEVDSRHGSRISKRAGNTIYNYIEMISIFVGQRGIKIHVHLYDLLEEYVNGEKILEDEDIIMVELYEIVEPGVYKGYILQNLTKSIRFE